MGLATLTAGCARTGPSAGTWQRSPTSRRGNTHRELLPSLRLTAGAGGGFRGLLLAQAKCKDRLDSGRRSRDQLTLVPSAAQVSLQFPKDGSDVHASSASCI